MEPWNHWFYSMMALAGWTKEMQGKLCAETTKTVVVLGNLLKNTHAAEPLEEQFHGKKGCIYPFLIEYHRNTFLTSRALMKVTFKEKPAFTVMIG